jgi:glycosyltransferase involved in cell wall biosynthesis
LIAEHDVIISQLPPYHYVTDEQWKSKYFVIDLYAPWFLEKLEYARIDPARGGDHRKDDLDILRRLLAIGDFYICASERQRDYWLGALTVAGRLNPQRLASDPEFRSLVDVVSFGLPSGSPIPNGPGPREAFENIRPGDPIVLWNGGIWNWLDPVTAIHATHILVNQGVPCRLVFMGIHSPSHEIAEMEMIEHTIALARDLDLIDKHVFFNDWVPYDERQNWLMQATMTLSLHQPTVESRFAFRTRVLDNLWCRVPLIATEGDVMADIVAGERLGEVVPPGNPVAVAAAMQRLFDPEQQRDVRRRIASAAHRYTWDQVAEPLRAFCADPWSNRNPDDSEQNYVLNLERLYTETAGYARDLERAVSERDEAIRVRDHVLMLAADRNKKLEKSWRARIGRLRDRA